MLWPLALGVVVRICLLAVLGTFSLNSRSRCILVSIRMIAPCRHARTVLLLQKLLLHGLQLELQRAHMHAATAAKAGTS